MNNYTRILVAILFALTATAFSCSQKDEPAAEVDAAVKSGTDAAKEASKEVMSKAEEMSDEMTTEAEGAVKAAMDEVEGSGEVAKIVDEAKDMAGEGLSNVEGMSEEELKKKAEEAVREKLGVND